MERRDWSIKALEELIYIDSLESYEKADLLVRWNKKYLTETKVADFDLEMKDLKKFKELFFKSINFLKKHKEQARQDMINNKKMQKFLNN